MENNDKVQHLNLFRGVVCFLILAAGAGISVFFAKLNIEPPTKDVSEMVKILEGMTIKTGEIQLEVTGYGTAEPNEEIAISSEVKGRATYTTKNLSVGLVVQKGEVLATIDESDYRLAVAEAKAELIQLQEEQKLLKRIVLNLEKEFKTEKDIHLLTKNSWERRKTLLKKRAVSQEDYENSMQSHQKQHLTVIKVESVLEQGRIRLKVNKAKIESAKVKLEKAKVDMQRSVIKAPFSGRLTKVSLDNDEYVNAGTMICEIADDSSFDVPVSIDAKIASKVMNLELTQNKDLGVWFKKPQGVEVIVEWPEAPERCRWNGYIKRVIKFDPETRTVVLMVRVTTRCKTGTKEKGLPLVSGMFCRVIFKGRTIKNAAKIPWIALQLNDKIAVVGEDSRLQERTPQIELVNQDNIIITGGVKSGEKVITQRIPRGLVDGTKVKVVEVSDNGEVIKQKKDVSDKKTSPKVLKAK